VTQWEIFDAYKEDFDKQVSKSHLDFETIEKGTAGNCPIHLQK